MGNQLKGWASIESEKEVEGAIKVISIYRKKNLLFINSDLFELNKPGFCRDGEDERGKYQMCIREILPRLQLTSTLSVDSVFVFERQFYDAVKFDSVTTRLFVSATENIMVRKELEDKRGKLIWKEQLIRLQRK